MCSWGNAGGFDPAWSGDHRLTRRCAGFLARVTPITALQAQMLRRTPPEAAGTHPRPARSSAQTPPEPGISFLTVMVTTATLLGSF